MDGNGRMKLIVGGVFATLAIVFCAVFLPLFFPSGKRAYRIEQEIAGLSKRLERVERKVNELVMAHKLDAK